MNTLVLFNFHASMYTRNCSIWESIRSHLNYFHQVRLLITILMTHKSFISPLRKISRGILSVPEKFVLF